MDPKLTTAVLTVLMTVIGNLVIVAVGWGMMRQRVNQLTLAMEGFMLKMDELTRLVERVKGIQDDVVGLQGTLRNGISARISELERNIAMLNARCQERHGSHGG